MDVDDDALPVGTRVGDYRIDGVLGRGGFAFTYEAWDTRLHRHIALKEFFPNELALRDRGASYVRPRSSRQSQNSRSDGSAFNDGLRGFLDEGRRLASLRHPGIVRVICAFEANNTAYLGMEMVEGKLLSEFAQSRTDLRETHVRRFATQIISALAVVHRAGLLHRDINPSNIMIDASGAPVLIDFGSARMTLAEASRTMHAVVTDGYSPPEQYSSSLKNQGPWTDIYSLGATLYTICSGHRPCAAPDRFNSIFHGEVDPLDSIVKHARPGFSAELLQLIDACLQVRPKDRPQSVQELQHWLGPVQAREQTARSGRPDSPSGPGDSGEPTRPVNEDERFAQSSTAPGTRPLKPEERWQMVEKRPAWESAAFGTC